MELFADDVRVAALESALPALSGHERIEALVALAWHLRQRDTRRARSLAAEAGSLIGTQLDPGHDLAAAAARARLTLAECGLLFLEIDAARREASGALCAFQACRDAAGAEDAEWVLARIARHGPRDGAAPEALALPRSAPAAALECHRRHAEGIALMHAGVLDRAIESFCRVAHDAPLQGMGELGLEAGLGIARAFAHLQDAAGATEAAEDVLDSARSRGWRGFVVAASATLSQLMLQAGHPARAEELLHEARVTLAAVSAAPHDPALDYLLGQAQLAAGRADRAAETLARAEGSLRGHESVAELPRVLALQARALGRTGQGEHALERAARALRLAREARTRRGEMEALRTLGELHTTYPCAERTPRSALALLRHAAEIADEIGDREERASILRDIARLHEALGELAAALAAERAACAESAGTRRRRDADHALAAQARWIRERQRLERSHARALEKAESAHASELQRTHETLEQLRVMGQDIARRLDAAAIVESLERHVASLADVHYVALFVFDRSGASLRSYAREGGRAIPVREIAPGDLESYAARCAREGRELDIELESARAGDSAELRDCATLWFGPVSCGERILGVLTVQSRRQRAYGDAEKRILRTVAGHVALALARAQVHEELAAQRQRRIETEEDMHRLATVDRLTGLATRAHFFAIARERLERSRRDGGPCGLIVADMDGFKSINDTRGHEAGDRVLAAVGRVLSEHQRGDDVAGRIGGEEFALLLPGASLGATVDAAERIRMAIERLRLACEGRPVAFTMSFGCTAVADAAIDIADRPVDATIERLAREADAALYEAQGTGGNRAIAWPAYQALRALRRGGALERPPQSFA